MLTEMNTASPKSSLDHNFLNSAKKLGLGELHFKVDAHSGLMTIVAIHSTKLGPSLGGCRFKEYESIDAAIYDVMRLAQGMSYKAAISGLALGGGKSVILKPAQPFDRTTLFQTFGQFIQDLGGRYIVSVDSGTSPDDMDIIAEKTSYVTGRTNSYGDPSPFTAIGVKNAILAAVKFKLGKDDIKGMHVAIQGVGHVGKYLAEELHKLGARLSVTDINPEAVAECVHKYNATAVNPNDIYKVDCDIFSPCALGAVINDETIQQIKAPIIVGAANNQLTEPRHGKILADRGVLYGPDYVVNAGGLICVSAEYYKTPLDVVRKQVDNIYNTTLNIFERAAKENNPPSEVADKIAEEKLR